MAPTTLEGPTLLGARCNMTVSLDLEDIFNERVQAAMTYVSKLWSKEFDRLYFDKERRQLKTASFIGFLDSTVVSLEKNMRAVYDDYDDDDADQAF
jgi:hypothetical protein